MTQGCECAPNWRIELTNLFTGAVRHTVTPTEFTFETVFQEPGRGTITFNRKGADRDVGARFVHVEDMTPDNTGIFFSRIHGGAATPDDPVVMFGGFVETMDSSSDGMVTLGFAEIQKYLDYRLIRSDLVFTGLNQNDIGANLVLYARGENPDGGSVDPDPSLGIPLLATFFPTAFNRDRTYLAADRVVIGDAIRNLTQVINGPVYALEHQRNVVPIPGVSESWLTFMIFEDTWTQPSVPYIAWPHVTDLNVRLDGNGLANLVDAYGEPFVDGSPRIQTAPSPWPDRPRFDAAPTFDGVTDNITLLNHAFGYQEDHMDPAMDLQLTFSGLDYGRDPGVPALSLDDLVPGNRLNLDINSPYWVIRGGPDLPGSYTPVAGRVSVSAKLEGPEEVTMQVIADSFPTSMLSTPPAECRDC